MTSSDNFIQQDPSTRNAKRPKKRKSRWWILLLAIFGIFFAGFFILIFGFFVLFGTAWKSKPVTVKPNTVLRLNVPGTLEEYAPSDPLAFLSSTDENNVNFLNTITAIKKAKNDDNIVGIYIKGGDIHAGFAKIIEIRDALLDFKKSGKFIYAFIEIGRESDYYLASVADSLFMPTEGIMELNGFAIAGLFLKGTYSKLGVDFYVQQFEEFKSAGETYDRFNFSEPARKNLKEILDQRYKILTNAIARSRELSLSHIESALDQGLYSADAILENGFIDAILPEGDVEDLIKKRVNGNSDAINHSDKLRTISLAAYKNSAAFRKTAHVASDKQICVIYGSGTIVSGDSGDMGPFEESLIASRSFIRYLRKAREDKKIKAIILRLDSPGGSVLASDAIWDEILKTSKMKPVYASMSDVAASGGYYLAMACDSIIAHPATITGSIGVISIIPNFSGTLDKIDATVDTMATNPSSLFINPFLPFSQRDKNKFYSLSEKVYRRFVERVAERRHISYAQARHLARGKVWTGQDAYKVGLVDTLGGLQTTINIVKRRLDIPQDQQVRVKFYPEPEDSFGSLLKLLRYITQAKQINKFGSNFVVQTPLWNMLPQSSITQIAYLMHLGTLSQKEKILTALPFLPIVE